MNKKTVSLALNDMQVNNYKKIEIAFRMHHVRNFKNPLREVNYYHLDDHVWTFQHEKYQVECFS